MREIRLDSVRLPNGEIYTYRHAPGGERVVVFVHGNLASSLFFVELMQELPEEFTVFAVDLRGFGGSSYNQPLDGLRDLAGDLRMFVDELGLNKFDLLGWSMGGAVCRLFAAAYPLMVNRLFLVCAIGADGYHSYAVDEVGNKVQLVTREQIRQDQTKGEMVRAVETGDGEYYRGLWLKAIYNVRKPSPEVLESHVQETLKQRNMFDIYYCVAKHNMTDRFNGLSMGTEELFRIQVPTILIHGADDLLVPVEKAEEQKNALGEQAQLVVLEECGHSPFVDRLADVVELLVRS